MSWLLGLIASVVCLFPERLRGPTCWAIGGLARWLWPGRVRVARRNLEAAWFGDPPVRPKAIFQHLVGVGWDFLRIPQHRARGFAMVQVHGWPRLQAALSQGKGALVVSGHVGSWELVASALAHRAPVPVHLVVKRLGLIDAWVKGRRADAGLRSIVARGPMTVRSILKALADGEIVVLPVDQHAPRRNDARPGILTSNLSFFDWPAATTLLPAWLSVRANVPLLSVVAWRAQDGMHQATMESVPTDGAEPAAIMQMVTSRIEAAIRAHPSQWTWTHRRWKVNRQAEAFGDRTSGRRV